MEPVMETSTKRNLKRNLRRNGAARRMAVALALATALGGMSTTLARADDRGHAEDRQGQEQRGRQQQHVVQHHAPQHRGYVYERPHDYGRAPPPVDYYQPQPPPALDFVFPLYVR
jgi:hypothetical protein